MKGNLSCEGFLSTSNSKAVYPAP